MATNNLVEATLAKLEQADTLEGIQNAIIALRAYFGVENMVYH